MNKLGNVFFFSPFFGSACKEWKYPLPESVKKLTCVTVWIWGFLCGKILYYWFNFFNGIILFWKVVKTYLPDIKCFFINPVCWTQIPDLFICLLASVGEKRWCLEHPHRGLENPSRRGSPYCQFRSFENPMGTLTDQVDFCTSLRLSAAIANRMDVGGHLNWVWVLTLKPTGCVSLRLNSSEL